MALAIAIKIYPIFLLIPRLFDLEKRINRIIRPLAMALVMNLIALFTWNDPLEKLRFFQKNILTIGIRDVSTDPLFVSSMSIIKNTFGIASNSSEFRLLGNTFSVNFILAIGLMVTLIAMHKMNNLCRNIVALSLMQFMPLVSFNYTRIWVIPAIALILHSKGDIETSRLGKYWHYLACSLVLLNTVLVPPSILNNSPTVLLGSAFLLTYIILYFFNALVSIVSFQFSHLANLREPDVS
jgi:hypothetical protein